jgi:hypothetical protein
MQKPPLDPEVADFAPTDVTLTVYDEEYVVTYLLCLMPMRRVPTGERFRGSYRILIQTKSPIARDGPSIVTLRVLSG